MVIVVPTDLRGKRPNWRRMRTYAWRPWRGVDNVDFAWFQTGDSIV